jgi:molecular chaperone GrpE
MKDKSSKHKRNRDAEDDVLHIPVSGQDDEHPEDPATESPESTDAVEDAPPEDPPSGEPVPREEYESLKQERDELFNRLQRLAADTQNFQKRAAREHAQAREFANEGLIKELLGVIDDMERALQAARDNHGEDNPFFQGMQLVHDKMMAVLKSHGLEPIVAEGQPFDPELHSALIQQPSEEHPPMTVLQELQRGYTLKGRAIRPAGVAVSTNPQE